MLKRLLYDDCLRLLLLLLLLFAAAAAVDAAAATIANAVAGPVTLLPFLTAVTSTAADSQPPLPPRRRRSCKCTDEHQGSAAAGELEPAACMAVFDAVDASIVNCANPVGSVSPWLFTFDRLWAFKQKYQHACSLVEKLRF